VSNLIRDETEEESAGFFGSGLAQGGPIISFEKGFLPSRKGLLDQVIVPVPTPIPLADESPPGECIGTDQVTGL
jgi:hypothetical protein